jgi:hypothetical protein
VTVFFPKVADVHSTGLEDPQAEQSEKGNQCEAAGVG